MSANGSFTRRSMLKFGGIAGLVAPILGQQAVDKGQGLLVPSADDITQPDEPIKPSLVERLLGRIERDENIVQRVRTSDGLDPDIASLRSVSPVMKAHMQKVRDRRKMSLMDKLHRRAGHDWWNG